MNRQSCSDVLGLLRLFVYGTLKRGYWNHDRFCKGALHIEEARVRGRLYELPSGIPVLEVPDADVLAVGTSDTLADVITQERLPEQPAIETARDEMRWRMIHGELMVFPNPQLSLPPIDRLEGFRPDCPSVYRRVLVPVKLSDECDTVAWCYVASCGLLRDARPTGRASWP